MKEKIIEKRVMKMKKVFVTLLMLMMVVGLFANNEDAGTTTTSGTDTAKITATVGAVNEAWFTTDSNLSKPGADVTVSLNNDSGVLDGNKTVTIYVAAKTNVISGCDIKISGSALTLDTEESPVQDNSYIDLLISTIEPEDNGTSQTYVASSPASGKPSDHYTTPEKTIEFNLTPEDGLDTLSKGLTIKINNGENNTKYGNLTAGDYSAWLIMTYSPKA